MGRRFTWQNSYQQEVWWWDWPKTIWGAQWFASSPIELIIWCYVTIFIISFTYFNTNPDLKFESWFGLTLGESIIP